MKACLKHQPDVLFQRIPANFRITADDGHTVYTLDMKIRHLISYSTSMEFQVILNIQVEIEHDQLFCPLINIYEY